MEFLRSLSDNLFKYHTEISSEIFPNVTLRIPSGIFAEIARAVPSDIFPGIPADIVSEIPLGGIFHNIYQKFHIKILEES